MTTIFYFVSILNHLLSLHSLLSRTLFLIIIFRFTSPINLYLLKAFFLCLFFLLNHHFFYKYQLLHLLIYSILLNVFIRPHLSHLTVFNLSSLLSVVLLLFHYITYSGPQGILLYFHVNLTLNLGFL